MPALKKILSQDPVASNEARLLAAANRCFEKYGAQKTFIEDIAKEAGLSRPTAYRVFSNRQALFEKVAWGRVDDMEVKMRRYMQKYSAFEDALVHGTIASMRLAKEDKIFMGILEVLGDKGMERYLVQKKSLAHKNIGGVWSDVIDKARVSGELRSTLTKEDVIAWIASVECILLLRADMNANEEEVFLRKFMVPALIEDRRLQKIDTKKNPPDVKN